MRGYTFAMSLLLVLVASAGAAPTAQNSSDLAARDKAWEAAFNAGDLAKVASSYTDDARLLPPNAPIAQGKAAIQAEFGQMSAAGLRITLNPIEAMVAGDLGYSVGAYEITDAGASVIDRGKYMEILRNVGGEWKVSNDTWNSDMPMAASGNMVIVHKVKDDARWFAAWDKEHGRREVFAQHGAPSVTIFASPDHPNVHALLIDVTDMGAFQAWITSPEAAVAKAEDGVLDEGFTVFTPRK